VTTVLIRYLAWFPGKQRHTYAHTHLLGDWSGEQDPWKSLQGSSRRGRAASRRPGASWFRKITKPKLYKKWSTTDTHVRKVGSKRWSSARLSPPLRETKMMLTAMGSDLIRVGVHCMLIELNTVTCYALNWFSCWHQHHTMDCYQTQIRDSVSHTWHHVHVGEWHALVGACSEEVNKWNDQTTCTCCSLWGNETDFLVDLLGPSFALRCEWTVADLSGTRTRKHIFLWICINLLTGRVRKVISENTVAFVIKKR